MFDLDPLWRLMIVLAAFGVIPLLLALGWAARRARDSYTDHTHLSKELTDSKATAWCGRSFNPLAQLHGQPPDPLQICPHAQSRSRAVLRLGMILHQGGLSAEGVGEIDIVTALLGGQPLVQAAGLR